MPGYENLNLQKGIFDLSHIEKKSRSDQTRPLAAVSVFRRFGCQLQRNLAFFNQYDVHDQH